MNQLDILQWVRDTALGAAARDVVWLWPLCESLHFVGLCLLFGALLVVDLRVLGLGKGLVSLQQTFAFIPVALAGGFINLVTGVIFFCAFPDEYWSNVSFRWKMMLIVFGGLNALAFEVLERRRLVDLAVSADADWAAKVIAATSLLTWVAVIVLGRVLPYTGMIG